MHPTTTVKNKPERPHTDYTRNNSTTNYLYQRLAGEALFSLQTFWSFRTYSNVHHFCTLIMLTLLLEVVNCTIEEKGDNKGENKLSGNTQIKE